MVYKRPSVGKKNAFCPPTPVLCVGIVKSQPMQLEETWPNYPVEKSLFYKWQKCHSQLCSLLCLVFVLVDILQCLDILSIKVRQDWTSLFELDGRVSFFQTM